MKEDVPGRGEITEALDRARLGDRRALDDLYPLVYDELRRVARRQLRGRARGQTLDTTALVNEAYLKLQRAGQQNWRDRNHFLSVSALAMRHVLVDEARRKLASKREAEDAEPLPSAGAGQREAAHIVSVHEALERLAEVNERPARLVELRFFGGLTSEEAAEVLGVSSRTVKRDWRQAKAFLHHLLAHGGPGGVAGSWLGL